MAGERDPNEAKSQDENELPRFSIPLGEVAGDGTTHTENASANPWQRKTIIERWGPVSMSCKTEDVVHGFYSEQEGKPRPASLIVLHFRFDPTHHGGRIKRAQINVRFSAMESGGDDPEVNKISLNDTFFVSPTTSQKTVHNEAAAGVGGNALGAEIKGELKRAETVEKTVTDATRVTGNIRTQGRNYGSPNTASWTLLENTSDKTGVPVSLRAAILVKRENANFKADVTVDMLADTLTRAMTLFQSLPEDDPVLFKFDMKPTNKLHKYDKEAVDAGGGLMAKNLGLLDLERPEFADITLRTVWSKGQKTK